MGKFKEQDTMNEEQRQLRIEAGEDGVEPLTEAEYEEAKQQEYYYYVIQEFYAICKVFGTEKVMQDLAELKKFIEKPEDKPRIQLL